MRILSAAAWAASICVFGPASAQASSPAGSASAGTAAPGEDLFKWGEYDSLIRVLEPYAREAGGATTHADSLRQAKSLLFLGVAFCATGNPGRADEAFSGAVQLDPQVELDRFYVTEEIANRFQATALRALRRRPMAQAAAPSPVPSPSLPNSPADAPHASGRPASGPPASGPASALKSTWVWLGVGTTAAIAAATGYFLLTDRREPAREEVTPIDLSRP